MDPGGQFSDGRRDRGQARSEVRQGKVSDGQQWLELRSGEQTSLKDPDVGNRDTSKGRVLQHDITDIWSFFVVGAAGCSIALLASTHLDASSNSQSPGFVKCLLVGGGGRWGVRQITSWKPLSSFENKSQ